MGRLLAIPPLWKNIYRKYSTFLDYVPIWNIPCSISSSCEEKQMISRNSFHWKFLSVKKSIKKFLFIRNSTKKFRFAYSDFFRISDFYIVIAHVNFGHFFYIFMVIDEMLFYLGKKYWNYRFWQRNFKVIK